MEIYKKYILQQNSKETPTHHKKAHTSWTDIKFSSSCSSVNLAIIKAKFTQKQLWNVWH